MSNIRNIDDEKDELLRNENKNQTFNFKASNHMLSKGTFYWCPFILPSLICITLLIITHDIDIAIAIGTIIVASVCLFSLLLLFIASYRWPKYYTVAFDNDSNTIKLYSKRFIKTSLIGEINYDMFDKIEIKETAATYCFFYYCRFGTRVYKSYSVYIIYKTNAKGSIQTFKMNEYPLTQNEGVYAMSVIDNINKYYQNCMKYKLKTFVEEQFEIGSYCCVDCEEIYYGVIIDYIDFECYKIIDLFQQTEKIVRKKELIAIQDEDIKKEMQQKYNVYLKNHNVNQTIIRAI